MNLAPHPWTLRQLQYVVAVADISPFRRAPRNVVMSQPSLECAVGAAGESLECIFERHHKVILTEAVMTSWSAPGAARRR